MSLIIYPYKRDLKSNQIVDLSGQINDSSNNLFGFETWRTRVWNSHYLKSLNCELLNSLVTGDIYAEGEHIQYLNDEIELVKQNISIVTDKLNLDLGSFKFRLENGLAAIRVAQETINGGVYIG